MPRIAMHQCEASAISRAQVQTMNDRTKSKIWVSNAIKRLTSIEFKHLWKRIIFCSQHCTAYCSTQPIGRWERGLTVNDENAAIVHTHSWNWRASPTQQHSGKLDAATLSVEIDWSKSPEWKHFNPHSSTSLSLRLEIIRCRVGDRPSKFRIESLDSKSKQQQNVWEKLDLLS